MLTGFRLSAGLVWPVSSPPIPNGAVLVGPDGRIRDVGPDARVPRPPGFEKIDVPGGVLLPGLVNVHTHLELTGFRGQVEDASFFDWIQHVRRRKAESAPAHFADAARRGIRECWSQGVTTVADTGDTGAASAALTELGGRGIAYQEVFGPHPDQCEESFTGLVAAVERLQASAGPGVRIGVSPHAPYTVSAPLFRRVADFARAEGLPIAVHLAESKEETAFVTAGAGPFAEMWRRREIPLPVSAVSSVAFLDSCGVLGPNVLAIHAVQASEADLRLLAERGCAVALCPCSNRRHGHGSSPIAGTLRAAIPCGLGTDSSASVGALDLFAEARAAREAGIPANDVIRLLTLGGAEALGMGGEIGSLEPGKWADLCLLERRGDATAESILSARVQATWVAGRQVFGV